MNDYNHYEHHNHNHHDHGSWPEFSLDSHYKRLKSYHHHHRQTLLLVPSLLSCPSVCLIVCCGLTRSLRPVDVGRTDHWGSDQDSDHPDSCQNSTAKRSSWLFQQPNPNASEIVSFLLYFLLPEGQKFQRAGLLTPLPKAIEFELNYLNGWNHKSRVLTPSLLSLY